ncbi:MAG: metalloprotease TldD [Parvularculales bacterium]
MDEVPTVIINNTGNIGNDVFFTHTSLDRSKVENLVSDTLHGADDGELFLEYRQSEMLSYDDGRLRIAGFNTTQGFGLRCIAGEATGYAHASTLSHDAIMKASRSVCAVKQGHEGILSEAASPSNTVLYPSLNPMESPNFAEKIDILEAIDAYARSKDERVRQVSTTLAGSWQVVQIIRSGGETREDIRPLVRLDISIVAGNSDHQETGYAGSGGRTGYDVWLMPERWQSQVEEALRQALVNLESVDAPAGEMDVVLGPGWPGILLHEAVGHGLEGDFNRKKTSAFSDLLGERVAASGITVVDDGTIPERRGSLGFDDEGTPTQHSMLIEDGILKGYMHDRLSARQMSMAPTGNGRRESYAHSPMPRMTNTFMLPGSHNPDEILRSVKRGLYAKSFGGGQVDITSGKFVFSCTEAYLVENGRLGPPVKGATLIGNGPDVLTRVSMVGDDISLDSGIGTCGKEGQGVPVGVGQPTLRIDGLTVGGTAV